MDARIIVGVAAASAIAGGTGIVKYKSGGAPHLAKIDSHILMSDKDGRAIVLFETYPSVAQVVELYAGQQPMLKCHAILKENRGYCALRLSQALAGEYLSSKLHAETTLTDQSDVIVEFGNKAQLYQSTDDAGQALLESARWIDPDFGLAAIGIACDENLMSCHATLSNEPLAAPKIDTASVVARPCMVRVAFHIEGLGKADTLVSGCSGQESPGLAKYFTLTRSMLELALELPALSAETPALTTLHVNPKWTLPRGIASIQLGPTAARDLSSGLRVSVVHEVVIGINSPIQLTREWDIPFLRCVPVDEASNHQLLQCHDQCTLDGGSSSEINCRAAVGRTCGGSLALMLSDQAMFGSLLNALKLDNKLVTDRTISRSAIALSKSDPSALIAAYQIKDQDVRYLVHCANINQESMSCQVRDSGCKKARFQSDTVSPMITPDAALVERAANCFHVSLLAQR